jgi:hypothetical protein
MAVAMNVKTELKKKRSHATLVALASAVTSSFFAQLALATCIRCLPRRGE